jgi:hypothetical protein
VTCNDRSDARSVILRLRRYRDRIEEITAAATTTLAPADPRPAAMQRKLKSLKDDLDHDAHECGIGRKRAVQTDCEQRFLWPAIREAAGSMRGLTPPAAATAAENGSRPELGVAHSHILHYLQQLEGLYPTL